jgi:hypothetical protein
MMPMMMDKKMPMAGGDMPPMAEGGEKPANISGDDTLPVDSLAVPDEDEQMVAPEVGDRVTYTVEGRVMSVNGNLATIRRESVNGRPVEAAEKENPHDEMADLREEAERMGPMNG